MLGTFIFLTKFALHTGLLGATGLSIQKILLAAEHRRLMMNFIAILVAAVLLRLLLLNAELSGGFVQSLDFDVFRWIWEPNKVQTYAYVAGAVVLAFATFNRARGLYGLGAAILMFAIASGGHTQGLDAQGLYPPLLSIHVAIAAFWVTAPIVLWPHAGISDENLHDRMSTFSNLAVWIVPFLFVIGLILVYKLAGPVQTTFSTSYGRLLLLKLVLSISALCLGAMNKLWLTHKLSHDAQSARRLLRRVLVFEMILFAGAVSAIAAATSLTGPNA
jgi:copper resistance protein D